MRPVSYTRATDTTGAIATVAEDPRCGFLAGGTTQVDLLRINAVPQTRLVDINDLPLGEIESLSSGALRIGALARMSDVAVSSAVIGEFPMISQALLSGASPQLRNMASIGGNLMQRVRCGYFRDTASPCNKREPGSGCAAIHGVNRGHAVLGTSEQCIATHPSDLAVALAALDAVVHVEGPGGPRDISIDDFFLLPADTPDREHPLDHGELITMITVPSMPIARTSLYLKVRDRASYEFALASVAAALRVEGGVVTDVRLALGGVGTKPWRARTAERSLKGGPASRDAYERAADEELAAAIPRPMNAFKVDLTRRTMVRALETLAMGGTTL